MAKFTFNKDTKKIPKPITKTNIAKPKESYDPAKVSQQLQKQTVLKINALENALSISTQDETVDQAIDRVLNSLTSDEKRAYKLWLDMFEKKEKD